MNHAMARAKKTSTSSCCRLNAKCRMPNAECRMNNRSVILPRRVNRGGFTFIEILFSVIILGVGMIMIAGMLPVAIKQTADSRNDLTARVVADGGYAYLRTLSQTHPEAFPETTGKRWSDDEDPFTPKTNTPLDDFMGDTLMSLNNSDDYTPSGAARLPKGPTGSPKAGRMMPLSFDVAEPDPTNSAWVLSQASAAQLAAYPLLWHQLNLGDRILSGEPRFQWLGFYRRDESANVAKLVIVAMRQQNTEAVDRYGTSTTMVNEKINALNGPFLVPVEIEDSLTEPDKVKFVGTPGNNAWDIDVAETGSYLIIAHSPPLNGNPNGSGDLERPFRNNGRVFKLAARRDDLDSQVTGGGRVWELAPGFDLAPADPGPDGVLGTADDLPDGSMNPTASFDTARAVAKFPLSDNRSQDVTGTTTWAWLIGRGRIDPTATGPSPYTGATQDLGVLTVDMPLK